MSAGIRIGAVVPAAGRGARLGSELPKALVPLRGRPLVCYTLAVLHRVDEIEAIVVAAPPDAVDAVRDVIRRDAFDRVTAVVPGGAERQASVAAGLRALAAGPEVVVVHDGVRPLASPDLVRAVARAAAHDGAAAPALPLEETVRRGDGGWAAETVDRRGLFRVQTPQAFRRALLERAHDEAARGGFVGTDDAGLVERLGHRVRLLPGEPHNLKVTVPEDLALAEALLLRAGSDGRAVTPRPVVQRRPRGARADLVTDAASPRVGIGFDAHRLAPGRRLVLGGVEIPSPRGLLGHSDADVVVHAVMDALLGAAGCGDIGQHFPPDDPAYAGVSSLALLESVRTLLAARGWRAAHVDVVVLAEAPPIAPHVPAMRGAMARALGIEPDRINVKATTLEGMGPIGREEGIAAQAVASLERG